MMVDQALVPPGGYTALPSQEVLLFANCRNISEKLFSRDDQKQSGETTLQ